jgi:hypothetical protein
MAFALVRRLDDVGDFDYAVDGWTLETREADHRAGIVSHVEAVNPRILRRGFSQQREPSWRDLLKDFRRKHR